MQVKEYNMTFDELLTLFDDNKVPYKLIEILTGPKEDVYVINIYLPNERGDKSE